MCYSSFIVLSSLLAIVIAQRPGYLGTGPIGYPSLGSRFQTETPSTISPSVDNRLAENDVTTATTTLRIPIDARGDTALVDRLNQWPREHRPFWILNAEHIEKQRNPQGQPIQGGILTEQDLALLSRGSFDQSRNTFGSQSLGPLQTRGSFAGSLR